MTHPPPIATPMKAPERGICAETGREFRAGDDVVYVPRVGFVLPDAPSAQAHFPSSTALLEALGFVGERRQELITCLRGVDADAAARLAGLVLAILQEPGAMAVFKARAKAARKPRAGKAPAARKGSRR